MALPVGLILQGSALVYAAEPARPPVSAPSAWKPDPRDVIGPLKIHRNAQGQWIVEFDYVFHGDPLISNFRISQHADKRGQGAEGQLVPLSSVELERGAHHAKFELMHPGGNAVRTRSVSVTIYQGIEAGKSSTLQYTIDWPDWWTWSRDRHLAIDPVDELLAEAVGLIDQSEDSTLAQAKLILERIITRDPQLDAGYVELARVAMKTRWGPEGLHQAENLLSSALQIRPGSVNAKILLGYVYAHQRRYDKAEPLFIEAAKSDPPNLWLWANWGELYVMQNRIEPAMAKYRIAIQHPPTDDTYDRARQDAYVKLLRLLEQRKDLDGMEVLHRQRSAEYGARSCYPARYAHFLLNLRGDANRAAEQAQRALGGGCETDEARQVLGMAHYVLWSKDRKSSKGQASLNQARIYLPAGPMPLYLLASSEATAGALKALVDNGEPIDQRDNERVSALAYALQAQEHETAGRLIRLGARPDQTVGAQELPLALVPILVGDVDGVRLLQKSGINYATLKYQGASALDIARQTGRAQVISLLEPRSKL